MSPWFRTLLSLTSASCLLLFASQQMCVDSRGVGGLFCVLLCVCRVFLLFCWEWISCGWSASLMVFIDVRLPALHRHLLCMCFLQSVAVLVFFFCSLCPYATLSCRCTMSGSLAGDARQAVCSSLNFKVVDVADRALIGAEWRLYGLCGPCLMAGGTATILVLPSRGQHGDNRVHSKVWWLVGRGRRRERTCTIISRWSRILKKNVIEVVFRLSGKPALALQGQVSLSSRRVGPFVPTAHSKTGSSQDVARKRLHGCWSL